MRPYILDLLPLTCNNSRTGEHIFMKLDIRGFNKIFELTLILAEIDALSIKN
jgi:hypothetical protein